MDQPPRQDESDAARDAANRATDARAVERSTHTLIMLFAWAVAFGLLIYFFNALTLVLLLFLAAAAIAAVLRPLRDIPPIRRLGRYGRVASAAAIGVAFWILVAVVLAGAGFLFAGAIGEQMSKWPQTEKKLNATLQSLAHHLGLHQNLTVSSLAQGAMSWLAGNGKAGDLLALVANSTTSLVIGLLLVVFGSVFLLVEPAGELSWPLARLLPQADRPALIGALADLETDLRWWVLGTCISVIVVFGLTWGAFDVVGLDFALPLALLAGGSEIIPTLGPAIAFLIALLFAASQGTFQIVGVLIAWALIHLVEGYILLPVVMRKAVRLPPIVTLFTIVLWARLLGLLGLLLAVPLDLTIWVFLDHFVRRRYDR